MQNQHFSDYKDYIADQVRKNQIRYLETNPQPEALATRERLYGGKRVRDHPLAGYTAYSEEPQTLAVRGPTLMNRTFNDNIHQYEGAGFWDEIKKGVGKAGKEIFHDVIVPVGTSLAKDYVKSKMGGKRPRGRPRKHYVHHDVRMVEPEEHHHRVDGAGFWKDFGEGFKKGSLGTLKVAEKVLPLALMAAGRKPRGRPSKHGAGVWDEVKKGVGKAGKEIFHDVIVPVGTSLAKDYVKSKMGGKRRCKGGSAELYPPAVMKGGARTARGALIKKVMAHQGCSLGEASKYIKQNNLM